MANTISTDIDVLGLHRVVVQGTVDDPGNVANVEIFRDNKDVGSARVSASGNWRLTVKPSTSSTGGFFSAVVTDSADNQEILNPVFALSVNSSLFGGRLAQVIISTIPEQFNIFTSDGQLIVDGIQENINNKTVVTETGHGASVPFFILAHHGFWGDGLAALVVRREDSGVLKDYGLRQTMLPDSVLVPFAPRSRLCPFPT